ncbi:unnamed protein product [Rotaria sp. Silwood1]|nr:unnamed protein product [Rotaria sp. Silwood1]
MCWVFRSNVAQFVSKGRHINQITFMRLKSLANSANRSNKINDKELGQQQDHFYDKDLIDIDHSPLETNSSDSKRLEDIDADAAFAFQLQQQEYAKHNILSSSHSYLSSKRELEDNGNSLSFFLDTDDQQIANDRILAARLQEEENRTFSKSSSNQNNNRNFRGSRGRHNGNIQNIEENFRSEHNEDESIRKKGLTQHQINILPIEKFRSPTNKNDEENKCGVCWDEFELNQTLRRLTCLHLYHKQCIDPWLQRNNQCPICREPPIK